MKHRKENKQLKLFTENEKGMVLLILVIDNH